MEDTIHKINFSKNNYDVMSNTIIKAKQFMTLQEARLVRLLITQIVKEDKDFKTYVVSIKDLAKYLNISDTNLYRDIQNICDLLMTRLIKIRNGNPEQPWDTIHWVQRASYDGNGKVTLMLSNQLEPYLLSLNAWFTKYKFKDILAIDSFYALRIYELLKAELGVIKKYSKQNLYEIKFTIVYLKEFLECEGRFKRISDFKRYVLDICIREINNKSDLFIFVEYIKTKRTITDVKFYVKDNSSDEVKIESDRIALKDVESSFKNNKEVNSAIDIDNLIDELKKFIKEPLKNKDLKAILAIANNDIELVKSKYNLAKKQVKITNLTAWLISAIKNDYAEPVETESNKPMTNTPKVNRFVNYDQRNWDFEKLEKLEREYIKRNLER